MASAFLLSSNPSTSTTSSVFAIRPRSSSKSSFTYAAPRARPQHISVIAEPQHNDRFIDGDAPFLSDVECDLDISFASNMSIGSAPSSPPARPTDLPAGSHFLLPPQTHRAPSSPVPMDISPAPRRISSTVRVTSPSARASAKGVSGRAIVQELFRGFGHDVANLANNPVPSSLRNPPSTFKLTGSNYPQHGSSVSKSNSSRTRSALPSAWLQNAEPAPPPDPENSATPVLPKLGRNRSQTMIDPRQAGVASGEEPSRQQPPSVASVAWDASVSYDDMDVEAMDIDGDVSTSQSVTAPSSPVGPVPSELNELFFQPSSPVLESSSPDARATRKLHSPEPEEFVEFDLAEEIAHAQQEELRSSALVMGSAVAMDNLGSDDSQELDGSPARAYATRKAAPALRRDLLPTRPGKVEARGTAPNQSSPLTRVGLPGFGDNEADGKILPCHKVREDGLMRINCDTLDDLLAGHYDSRINSYRVIDCRFEYEYEGGHIPGAINLNTTQAIEDYLLGANKPEPSRSGDATKKDILVFHCEFSVKRAPTFAKHLRSRDRALNSHAYPKVHYPEVYVMAGGFCQYFKEKPSQVEPPYSYVRMDDPVHLRARHSDLNNFRRWERTKSYTYGEKQAAAAAIAQGQRSASGGSSSQSSKSHSSRSSAPVSNASSSSSSLSRRMGHAIGHGGSLSTLEEDGDSIYNGGDDEVSPCPPSAANYLRPGMLGGKPRAIGRIALDRAASFGFAMTKR
ncbi:cell division cycle- protein [Ceratobasidium sp. 370]|nr:cell division cycle- protein [Ceratobasidium sp. 370]